MAIQNLNIRPLLARYWLFLCFFAYQHSWFASWGGDRNYLISLAAFSLGYLTISGRWAEALGWYALRKMNGTQVKVILAGLLMVTVYRLSQIYIFETPVKPEVAAFIRSRPFLSAVIPMEDLFFTGILFTVLCGITGIAEQKAGRESYISGSLRILQYGLPFLVAWYWFLLPHQYATDFLNSRLDFRERIMDFPTDLFFGFLFGIWVFLKTGSLLPVTLLHFVFNGWGWIAVHWYR